MPEETDMVLEVQDINPDGSLGTRKVVHVGAPVDAIYATCLDANGYPVPGDDYWYDPALWDDSPHAMQGLADLIVGCQSAGNRLRLSPMPPVATLKKAFQITGHPWRDSHVRWIKEFSDVS